MNSPVRYICRDCRKPFRSRRSYQNHQKNAHPGPQDQDEMCALIRRGIGEYRCPKCGEGAQDKVSGRCTRLHLHPGASGRERFLIDHGYTPYRPFRGGVGYTRNGETMLTEEEAIDEIELDKASSKRLTKTYHRAHLKREVDQFISRTLRKGGHRVQGSTSLSGPEVWRRTRLSPASYPDIPPHADHQSAV